MLKTKTASRLFSVILALAVAFTFQFASAQEVSAAAKAKKLSLLASGSYEVEHSDGSTDSLGSGVVITYNKKGLVKAVKIGDYKDVYKRNKAGIVKSIVRYDGKKAIGKQTNTVKKGKIVKIKYKSLDGDIGGQNYTTTIKYKKGKKSKTITKYSKNDKFTTWYWTNGNPKRAEQKVNGKVEHYLKYDKKGYITHEKASSEDEKTEIKRTNHYNKNGDLKKYTMKTTGKIKEDGKFVDVNKTYTETFKYKYDKKKNLIQVISKDASNISNSHYKYKTVKVPKKYVKLAKQEQKDLIDRYTL